MIKDSNEIQRFRKAIIDAKSSGLDIDAMRSVLADISRDDFKKKLLTLMKENGITFCEPYAGQVNFAGTGWSLSLWDLWEEL